MTQGTPLITPYTLETSSDISATSGTLTGSLLPEGDHLEPTIGQIWPR